MAASLRLLSTLTAPGRTFVDTAISTHKALQQFGALLFSLGDPHDARPFATCSVINGMVRGEMTDRRIRVLDSLQFAIKAMQFL